MVEKPIDLVRVQMGGPAPAQLHSGVDDSRLAPALARPRGCVELGTENALVGVAPRSARVENGVEARAFVLAVPADRLEHRIQKRPPRRIGEYLIRRWTDDRNAASV
ncbi:MAG TPA: hypothetical protein VFN76_11505, partial [Candidatus Limnocylindria bacterium]|nr:hypothetical protein [Candidatus Limnocylindria bacterium]